MLCTSTPPPPHQRHILGQEKKACRLLSLKWAMVRNRGIVIWLKAPTRQQLMAQRHHWQQKTASTHIVLVQDLKYFVDVVQRVHSGRASLFGLRSGKHSTYQHVDCSLDNCVAAGGLTWRKHNNCRFVYTIISDRWRERWWDLWHTESHVKVWTEQTVCHHSVCVPPHHTFITPITLSAVSRGQLMERMPRWIAANCKSFVSLHIPQPHIITQL